MKIKPITKKFHANFTTPVTGAGVVESGPDTKPVIKPAVKQPQPNPIQNHPTTIQLPTDLTEAEERDILWEYENFIRFERSDNPDDQPPKLSDKAQKYLKLLERERLSGYEHPEIWGEICGNCIIFLGKPANI